MIISVPKLEVDNGVCTLSSDLSTRKGRKKIWFSVPEKYSTLFSLRCDGILVSLLPYAMLENENIKVKGDVSPALLKGITQYEKRISGWWPRFHEVKIQARIKSDNLPAKHCACGFSGGVDSSYTALSLKPGYAFFIHGRDIKLDDNSYDSIAHKYEKMLAGIGISMVPVRTNVSDFAGKHVEGYYRFGTEVIGTGLVLSNGIKDFYIASSYDNSNLRPCSSHPELDPLFSTESLQIIHQGSEINRIMKTKMIAESGIFSETLRVCENKFQGIQNCGCCEKCLRTTLAQRLAGHVANTFPDRIGLRQFLNWRIDKKSRCHYYDMATYAWHKKKYTYSALVPILIINSILIANPLHSTLERIWKLSAILKKKSPAFRRLAQKVKQ